MQELSHCSNDLVFSVKTPKPTKLKVSIVDVPTIPRLSSGESRSLLILYCAAPLRAEQLKFTSSLERPSQVECWSLRGDSKAVSTFGTQRESRAICTPFSDVLKVKARAFAAMHLSLVGFWSNGMKKKKSNKKGVINTCFFIF